MLCALLPFLSFYFGCVALLSRWLCPSVAHRKSHLYAAAIALGAAVFIGSFGVPYVNNLQDQVGLFTALGLIVTGPVLLPWLWRRRVGVILAVAVIAAFVEPVVRVEYLTWRHGRDLRQDFARVEPDSSTERLFSVFSFSDTQAEVFRVANGEGYFVRFEKGADGRWWVNPMSYPPQVLLWYKGNSGQYNCPYPTSILLIAHRTGEWCG
jgi:hypothetical protein